jgi:hypothetical protein
VNDLSQRMGKMVEAIHHDTEMVIGNNDSVTVTINAVQFLLMMSGIRQAISKWQSEIGDMERKLSAIDAIQKRVNVSWTTDDYIDGMSDIEDILAGKAIK